MSVSFVFAIRSSIHRGFLTVWGLALVGGLGLAQAPASPTNGTAVTKTLKAARGPCGALRVGSERLERSVTKP
jgi:hypothetical protein